MMMKLDAVIAAALATILLCAPARSKIIALDIDIVIDKASPDEKGIKAGDHHEARVFYDDTKIDPKTHRAVVIHEQHTPALIPKHLNPAQMPMSNAWLDLNSQPYRYHFAAAPTLAFPFPYFVIFDENTMRMTIYRQSDGSLLLAGPYTVNPTPITGPEIDAVVASSDPVVPPWVTTMTMPAMPGGRGAARAGDPSPVPAVGKQ
jgi:hypothetical protein